MPSVTQNRDGTYRFVSSEPFTFVSGETIPELTLVYEINGKLNATRDNAILIPHAFSTNSHIMATPENPQVGWWENMVGSGKPIDTDYFCVICINNVGSCFGSSGPASPNPQTMNETYRLQFPHLTIEDIAHSQWQLLDYLGINSLHAAISASMGGMIALAANLARPRAVRNLVLLSSAARSYPSSIATHCLQREIIRLDPEWQQGNYTQKLLPGFLTARKLAHYTYRNPEELNKRFLTDVDHRTIDNYLSYNAQKFIERFDANCYLYLNEAMDEFDVTRGFQHPAEVFRNLQSRVLQISASSDILFTAAQQIELHEWLLAAGVDSQHVIHQTNFGHDAFLVECAAMGAYIHDFITMRQ